MLPILCCKRPAWCYVGLGMCAIGIRFNNCQWCQHKVVLDRKVKFVSLLIMCPSCRREIRAATCSLQASLLRIGLDISQRVQGTESIVAGFQLPTSGDTFVSYQRQQPDDPQASTRSPLTSLPTNLPISSYNDLEECLIVCWRAAGNQDCHRTDC